MRNLVLGLLICLFALPAHAQVTFSIQPSPTSFGGNDGFTLQVSSTGAPEIEEFFLYEEAGLIRFGAERVVPDAFSAIGYTAALAPITTGDVTPGMSFPFLDDDCAVPTATYEGMFEITVPAGTFMTYRFDVPDNCFPGAVERFYWADGVGLVRLAEYNELGGFDSASDLSSFTNNGGTGLFPRAVGNEWNFTEGSVPTEDSTFGTLKAKYTD